MVPHFSANRILLCLSEVEVKICKRLLQALLSSAPCGVATHLCILSRLASLAINRELASCLYVILKYHQFNCSCQRHPLRTINLLPVYSSYHIIEHREMTNCH